jgi:hypothetical protein
VLVELQVDRDVAAELRSVQGVERVEPLLANGGRRRYRLTGPRGGDTRLRVSAQAAQQGWGLFELRTQEASLEEIYLRAVASDRREA